MTEPRKANRDAEPITKEQLDTWMQSLAQDRLYKKLKMEADPDVQLYNKASALYENLFIDKSKFHKTQQQGDNTSVNQLEAFFKKYKGGHDSPDKTDEKTDAEKAL